MIVKWNPPNGGLFVVPNDNGNDLVLQPGPNEVPTATWKTSRRHVLDRIERGDIVEVGVELATESVPEKKGPGGKVLEPAQEEGGLKTVTEFAGLGINEASALALETTSLVTLKAWLEPETRGAVATALRKQIQKMEDLAAGKNDGEQ